MYTSKWVSVAGLAVSFLSLWIPYVHVEENEQYTFYAGSILTDILNSVSGRSGHALDIGNILPFALLIISMALLVVMFLRLNEDSESLGLITGTALFTTILQVLVLAMGIAYGLIHHFDNHLILITSSFSLGLGSYLAALGLALLMTGVAQCWREANEYQTESLKIRLKAVEQDTPSRKH